MTDSRIIARWLTQDELTGSRRSVTVGPDQIAIVITDGVYGEPHTEGKFHTRARFELGGGPDIEVLIVDVTRFDISFALGDDVDRKNSGIPIMTKDGKVVAGKVTLSLVANPDNASRLVQLRRGRSQVTDQDIADVLRNDLFAQVIRPNVTQINSFDLRGSADEFAVLYGDTQLQLNSLLDGYGLELQSIAPELIPARAKASAELQQLGLDKKTSQMTKDARPHKPRPKRKRATAIVTNRKGEVLLVRNKNTRHFSLPGGRIRSNERASMSVARHLYQETRLTAHKTNWVCDHDTSSNRHAVYRIEAHGRLRMQKKELDEVMWWNLRDEVYAWDHVEAILKKAKLL